MGGGCPRVAWGLQVAAAAAVLVVAGPPFVVAERRLAAARAVGCLLVLGPAGPQVAAGGRPAGPLGPCFVSRAAPRLRRRRPAAAVVREQREGLPALVLD